jgi:putative SOS response-associated peptidase YedK
MVITEPNAMAAEIHDRMPAFLQEEQFEPWLKGEAGTDMLKPAPDALLLRWHVSQRVNSSRADANDPTLIDEVDLTSTVAIV